MDYTQSLADSLKGSDVVLSGKTVSGVPFIQRRLENITIKAERGHYWVDGWCPIAKGVRRFRLDLIETMLAAPAAEPSQKTMASVERKVAS